MTASFPGSRAVVGVVVLGVALLIAGCGEQRVAEQSSEPMGPVEIRAEVDRATATTGDLILFSVTADHDRGFEVEFPELGNDIGGLEIVDMGRLEPRKRRGRLVEERWYELRADLVGSHELPAMTVRYREVADDAEIDAGRPTENQDWQSDTTQEITVEVESVLPADGTAAEIRGLKPLHRVAREIPWRWILLAALLIATAAAAVFWLRWRRQREQTEIPVESPHVVALRALAALRAVDLDDPKAVRRFYFDVSETLRAYVEGRFGLNATDLTTDEILAVLPDLPALGEESTLLLHRFLLHTDQVKFADYEPRREEIKTTWERAREFVETNLPVVAEQEGEPEEKAA